MSTYGYILSRLPTRCKVHVSLFTSNHRNMLADEFDIAWTHIKNLYNEKEMISNCLKIGCGTYTLARWLNEVTGKEFSKSFVRTLMQLGCEMGLAERQDNTCAPNLVYNRYVIHLDRVRDGQGSKIISDN